MDGRKFIIVLQSCYYSMESKLVYLDILEKLLIDIPCLLGCLPALLFTETLLCLTQAFNSSLTTPFDYKVTAL